MHNKKSRIDKNHDEFLRRVGVGKASGPDKFARRLEQRFGKRATEILDIIEHRASGETDEDLWRLKNEDLDLSLALTSYFLGDFYRCYLPWIESVMNKDSIKTVLDIGCDNGVLTCCYANMFPGAQVLGIDQSPAGIDCAIELARRLGLSNIHFRQFNALHLPGNVSGTPFDLITATRTFNSIFAMPDMPRAWSLSKVELPDSSKWQDALVAVATSLAAKGRFVSVEMFTTSAGVLWWANAIKDAGLNVNWSKSELLRYKQHGESISDPALICDRVEHADDRSLYDCLAFSAGPELVELAKQPFEGDAAEALFGAFGDRNLIWGLECSSNIDTDHAERFEVWDANTVILAYQYSNTRARRLVIAPFNKQQECIETVKQSWQERENVRLREYISVSERDS